MSIGRTDAYTVHALPAWNRETYLRQAIIQWILSIGFSICESRPPTGIDPRLFLRKISLREGIWWLISIERISFFKYREGCVIWLGKEGYSKEDGENYCCFFKERKVSRETKVLVKLPSRRDVGGNRLKSVSFFSEVVHRCFLPRCQNSNIIVDLLLTRRFCIIEPEEQWHKCEITRSSGDKEKQFYLIEFNYVAERYFFTMEQKNSYRIYSYCTFIYIYIYTYLFIMYI